MTDPKGMPKRALNLQRKLNGIFVRKRDVGENTQSIYAQLKIVERWLSKNRIYWP